MSAGQDFAKQVADPTNPATWADDPRLNFAKTVKPETQGETDSE